jgi:hypothetical protein
MRVKFIFYLFQQGLFDNMKNASHRDHNFRTEVSYLEIYNEKVRDLLRVTCNLRDNNFV